MAQQNFPLMIAVDWLSMTLISEVVLTTPENRGIFVWEARTYGTKQFRNVFDIAVTLPDGDLAPFGVCCTEPTLETWAPGMMSLKIDNHLLYDKTLGYWLDILQNFIATYSLSVKSISRCDLAGDFIYLHGRVSGSGLIKRLKNFTWWKCGTVKVSEHYSMPYTLGWTRQIDHDGIDTDIYLQNGQVAARSESMTFGTMASDAQVCLYDKTQELNRTEVTIKRDGEEVKESAKEYIRDCHREAGVYDPQRHTWRLEIRLRNKALCIFDNALMAERPIYLDDLVQSKLPMTFLAAADRYFRIVDATDGGAQEVTPSYMASMKGHKNRLPVVHLFDTSAPVLKFCSKKYHQPANRYHRAIITRLDQLGDRLHRCPAQYTKDDDATAIPDLLQRLKPLATRLAKEQSSVIKASNALAKLHKLFAENPDITTPEDMAALTRAKEVLERHYNTESPTFTRNIISTLTNYASKMESMLAHGSKAPFRRARSAHPSDSQVLLDAAAILKGVFVNVCYDERREKHESVYYQHFVEAVFAFNDNVSPPGWVLDCLSIYARSNRYIETHQLEQCLNIFKDTDFYYFYLCKFNLELFAQKSRRKMLEFEWTPPLLPLGSYREAMPYLDYIP